MNRHLKMSPRSQHWLREQSGKDIRRFAVCDVEGINWITHVMMGYYDGDKYRWFRHVKEFMAFLKDDHDERKREGTGKGKTTIFAHFGGKYDFLFILNHILLESSEWSIDSMIPRGSGILCFDAVYMKGSEDEFTITFTDSSAMLPFGLKRLTNSFGVETKKGDWDHTKTLPEPTPELIAYNKDDCMGLYQVIARYFNWPMIRRSGSATTIAGQAMKVLQTKLPGDVWSLSAGADAFVRKAYFGGRTEIFKPLFNGPGQIHCADVNSLYPTIMKENEFPVKFKSIAYEYKPGDLGFFDAEVEVPEMYVPPLGVVWEVDGVSKYIFPTGRFHGRFSTLELEYAKSVGVKIRKLGRGILFHSGGYIFKDYVDELYEIREKSARDSVDNVLSKLLLNSCYGRFGIRLDRENLVIDDGLNIGSEYCTIGKLGKEVRLLTQAKKLDAFSNVAVSAWVTSASRVFMHRKYMEAPDQLYYTDTDSVFTTKKYADEKGLGGFKIEYSRAAACFLLPKTYITTGETGDKKVTMKGFTRGRDGRKLEKFTMEDFVTALEGDLRLMRTTQDAKMATFKSALRKGEILTMLPETEKAIRSSYDKRIVFKSGGSYDTRAHRILDSEPIVLRGDAKKAGQKVVKEQEEMVDSWSV